MNSEYLKRLKRAEDAADEFYKKVQETGDIGLLEEDSEVQELYYAAYDIIKNDSEEEQDWYSAFSDYHRYACLLIIHSESFAKELNGRRSITSKEFAEICCPWTDILDDAIEQNGKYKALYQAKKAEDLADFKEALKKLGISVQTGGCYIATAVYGSYDCPQVWTLRRYRDIELSRSFFGKIFIRVYYTVSPSLVKWLGDKSWFIRWGRGILDMIVTKLNHKGYQDTPYIDTMDK